MTAPELAALNDLLADLQRKLAARERAGGGYTRNIEMIKARIVEVQAQIDNG